MVRLLDFIGRDHKAIQLQMCSILERIHYPTGDAETTRAASSISKGGRGHCLTFRSQMTSGVKWGLDSCLAEPWGQDPAGPAKLRGRMSTPVGLEGRVRSQRGLFLRFRVSWRLPCQILDSLDTLQAFLIPSSSLLEGECLSCACPTNVF